MEDTSMFALDREKMRGLWAITEDEFIKRFYPSLLEKSKQISKKHSEKLKALMGDDKEHLQVA